MGLDEDARAAAARFRAACETEPLVVAAFLGGSLAAGTADAASDLDLYVVTREQDYASFFVERERFIRSWSVPLFLGDTLDFEGLGFDMAHFVLADGVHGELAFGHAGNFLDLHGGPYEVLVDKVGLLVDVTFPLYDPLEEDHRSVVEHALGWFFYDALDLGKLLVRARPVTAALALVRLRVHCSALIDAVAVPAQAESLRERLRATVPMADASDMWRATFALVELHGDAGRDAAARHGLPYPDELVHVVCERLREEERLGRQSDSRGGGQSPPPRQCG